MFFFSIQDRELVQLQEKAKIVDINNLQTIIFDKDCVISNLEDELRALRLIHIRNHKMMNIMLCCFETIDDEKTIKIKDDVVEFTGIYRFYTHLSFNNS